MPVEAVRPCLEKLPLWPDLQRGVNSVVLHPHFVQFDVEFVEGPLGELRQGRVQF